MEVLVVTIGEPAEVRNARLLENVRRAKAGEPFHKPSRIDFPDMETLLRCPLSLEKLLTFDEPEP